MAATSCSQRRVRCILIVSASSISAIREPQSRHCKNKDPILFDSIVPGSVSTDRPTAKNGPEVLLLLLLAVFAWLRGTISTHQRANKASKQSKEGSSQQQHRAASTGSRRSPETANLTYYTHKRCRPYNEYRRACWLSFLGYHYCHR